MFAFPVLIILYCFRCLSNVKSETDVCKIIHITHLPTTYRSRAVTISKDQAESVTLNILYRKKFNQMMRHSIHF